MAPNAVRPSGRLGRLLYDQPTARNRFYGRVLDGLDLVTSDALLEVGAVAETSWPGRCDERVRRLASITARTWSKRPGGATPTPSLPAGSR
jgi:hypothetical protein